MTAATALTLDGTTDGLWCVRRRCDVEARLLADRHYSRRTPGAVSFMPAGRALVLVSPCGRAVWGTSYTIYPDDGLDAWRCTIFRNEGAGLSSDLIRAAMALTAVLWGSVPPAGWVTWVRPGLIRSTNPGFCFLKAGWRRDSEYKPGRRRGDLVRLRAS